MKSFSFAGLISLCLAILFTSPAFTQTYSVETRDFRLLFYGPQHSYIAPHVTRCFENSLRFHRALFGYVPSEEVTTILSDENDFGNAGTSTIPWNHLSVGLEPYDYVYETGPTNERMNWVMNHELAHLVATDQATSSDRFFRSMFLGKVSPTSENPLSMIYSYLTTPRWYSARWYHEGFAVFLETWMAGGIGRVLGGYDEMVFRAMVNDSSYFYDCVGIESEGKTIDFQVGVNSYLYGTRFVSYLAYVYGPEKLLKWFNRTEGTARYFASQFENVYGISLDDEWSRWIDWEHTWQRANLDSIHHYPITPYRKIVDEPLGSVSRVYYDSTLQRLFTAVNLPGHLANIVSIDVHTGSMTKICKVPHPALYYVTSLAYDPEKGTLFFTTHNNRYWRGIQTVNVRTGKVENLLSDARIGDLVFNQADKSLWGMQHHNGYSTLVRIPAPYDQWKEILPLKYGKDFFDLDISPDGKWLTASVIEISGKQTLVKFEIEKLINDEIVPDILLEFENSTAPYNFVFSQDGNVLFGTSYYSGASNVFRFNLQTRKLDCLTNAETGFFRPQPISVDSLVAFRYTGKGFLPAMLANKVCEDVSAIRYLGQEIVEKYPALKTWTVGSPLSVNFDSVVISKGEYHALQHLRLASVYPIVEGYKNVAAFGARFEIEDPGSEHFISGSLSFSPNRSLESYERVHGSANYYFGRWQLRGNYNGADFFDLFGPTKTSRKGYSLSVGFTDYLIYDSPRTLRYNLSVAGYGDLERLPEFQNIAASYDKFFTSGGSMVYSNVLRSLGAVDEEEGVKWSLNLNNTFVRKDVFPKVYTSLDIGFLLPIDHSSIWLRGTAGRAFGDFDQSFANFYFGGFGNNWIDHQEEKRYRTPYSFPGIELDEAGGPDFGKIMFEWNLPPIRFRRFGFSTVYCNWSRIALFSSTLITDVSRQSSRRALLNVGIQDDFKLVIFSTMESTLSLGYAVVFERERHLSKEFMVSLKILR